MIVLAMLQRLGKRIDLLKPRDFLTDIAPPAVLCISNILVPIRLGLACGNVRIVETYLPNRMLPPKNFMEPSPTDALKSALAGGGAGPAWLIIGR